MNEVRTSRLGARALERILILLPVLSLVLAATAWLRYGIDMPWYDDWRGYDGGWIHSLEPRHLFQPINYTLSPVGLALDALAQRYLDGNSVAYQFLSMVAVLGSLLVLQWTLLRKVLGDRLLVAICFSFTVPMLQPGSYWGLENLAYHQALPLVFILAAILLLVGGERHAPWRGPVAGAMALLAGFTYISGAFGALAAGVCLLAVSRLRYPAEERRRLTRDAAWFVIAASITVAVQFYFSFLNVHRTSPAVALALPHELQFWVFYLGKLARSLLLPADAPAVSLGIAALAALALLGLALRMLRPAAASGDAGGARLAAVYFAMLGMVLVYLLMIAAARTNLRPAEATQPLQVFTHAFTRFHFFWATLLWPWMVAALLWLARQQPWCGRKVPRGLVVLAVAAFAAWTFKAGGFAHMESQRQLAREREAVAHCLLGELQKDAPIHCRGLLPQRLTDLAPDAYPSYAYALKTGASFVRNFPVMAGSSRREAVEPFFRLEGSAASRDTRQLQHLGEGRYRALQEDPQMFLQLAPSGRPGRCATLDVDLDLKVARNDTVQVYFQPAEGPAGYSEQNTATAAVEASGSFQQVRLRLHSRRGFADAIRLDPVAGAQEFQIREIRARCWRERA